MSAYKQVAFNTAAQMLGRIFSSAAAFFTTMLLASGMGAAAFGEYTKAITIVAILITAVDFGLNPVYVKRNQPTAADLSRFISLRLIMALISGLVALLVLAVVRRLNSGFTAATLLAVDIGLLSVVGQALMLSFAAHAQIERRLYMIAVVQGAGALFGLGLTAFVYPRLGFQPVLGAVLGMLVNALSILVAAGAFIYWLKQKKINLSLSLDLEWFLRVIRQGWPLGLVLFFNILCFRIDALVLAAYRPSYEVGAYGLAFRFFDFSISLPTFIMYSLFPEWIENLSPAPEFKKHLQKLFMILSLLSVIVGALLWFLAPLMGHIKSDYLSAVPLLRWLLLSLPVFYITSPLMWIFIRKNKQKLLTGIYFTALLVNLCLNLAFVPRWGATAAAVVTGITELVTLLTGLVVYKIYINR